jgi:hypothetical protein
MLACLHKDIMPWTHLPAPFPCLCHYGMQKMQNEMPLITVVWVCHTPKHRTTLWFWVAVHCPTNVDEDVELSTLQTVAFVPVL